MAAEQDRPRKAVAVTVWLECLGRCANTVTAVVMLLIQLGTRH
jgi:hypothetical protein